MIIAAARPDSRLSVTAAKMRIRRHGGENEERAGASSAINKLPPADT
jgi:hypothetical protein